MNAEIGIAKANESMMAKEVWNLKNYKLKEVVYIPDLSTNFVNAITNNGGEVLSARNEITINYKIKSC